MKNRKMALYGCRVLLVFYVFFSVPPATSMVPAEGLPQAWPYKCGSKTAYILMSRADSKDRKMIKQIYVFEDEIRNISLKEPWQYFSLSSMRQEDKHGRVRLAAVKKGNLRARREIKPGQSFSGELYIQINEKNGERSFETWEIRIDQTNGSVRVGSEAVAVDIVRENVVVKKANGKTEQLQFVSSYRRGAAAPIRTEYKSGTTEIVCDLEGSNK